MVHKHCTVHERYIRGAAGRDHLAYFIRVHANWFFDEDVFAGCCRVQHPLLVQFGRQWDVDRIDIFVIEQRVVAVCADRVAASDSTDRSIQLQLVAERLRLVQFPRCYGDERAALAPNDGSGILLSNRGTAHDSNAQCERGGIDR